MRIIDLKNKGSLITASKGIKIKIIDIKGVKINVSIISNLLKILQIILKNVNLIDKKIIEKINLIKETETLINFSIFPIIVKQYLTKHIKLSQINIEPDINSKGNLKSIKRSNSSTTPELFIKLNCGRFRCDI